jgi:cell division protein FtsB
LFFFSLTELWLPESNIGMNQMQSVHTELKEENEKLKEENRSLKEEYEKYKIRTNYLIKSAKQTSKVNNINAFCFSLFYFLL